MTSIGHFAGGLWRNLRVVKICGANTDVGKTVVAAGLARACLKKQAGENVYYIKPVAAGPSATTDHRRIAQLVGPVGERRLSVKTLVQLDCPVSPHVAAQLSGEVISDADVLGRLVEEIGRCSKRGDGTVLVEAAGGVLSPAPSGSLQADLYRPLRPPALLVADPRLGGIGTSLSALESLIVRGYDVCAMVIFANDRLGNEAYLRERCAGHGIPVLSLAEPPAPSHQTEPDDDAQQMHAYFEQPRNAAALGEVADIVSAQHAARLSELRDMRDRSEATIWHPFTQHQGRRRDSIVVIDSAYGDYFHTATDAAADGPVLQATFDASASWWTQGFGHGNPALALRAAYAAGRYGHVMFANAVHQPAAALAQRLLRLLGNSRLTKVFFSDNGSTGVEVALKMAFKAVAARCGPTKTAGGALEVVGLKGSYHGDTIAAMDCSEPSPYNKQVDWYRGKGFWFDYPRVRLVKGSWTVSPPAGLESDLGHTQTFPSLDAVFDLRERNGDGYEQYIEKTLGELIAKEHRRFGAVILEPVILGAGGMIFADPLFQQALVNVVRRMDFGGTQSSAAPAVGTNSGPADSRAWAGLPVISDEVFTGLHRLGRFSASSFLQIEPDISVHAKLLTGGLLPLCLTAASDSIFSAFLGDEKADALLHGHSYTAHPVGCEVARYSLGKMQDMEQSGHWDNFKTSWTEADAGTNPRKENLDGDASVLKEPTIQDRPRVWSMWSRDFTTALSMSANVEAVVVIGSVLAITVTTDGKRGYESTAANTLQERLFQGRSAAAWNVHSRVLGNVLYLIVSLTTSKKTMGDLEQYIEETLT